MANKPNLNLQQAERTASILTGLATFMEAHKATLFIDKNGSVSLDFPEASAPISIVADTVINVTLDESNLKALAEDFTELANQLRSKSAGLRYKVGDVVWAILEDEDDYEYFAVSKVRIIQLDPDDKYLPYEYVFDEDADDDDLSNWLSEQNLFPTREAAFDAYRKRLRDRYSKHLARLDKLEHEDNK